MVDGPFTPIRVFLTGEIEGDVAKPPESLLYDENAKGNDRGFFDEVVEFILLFLGHFLVEGKVGGISTATLDFPRQRLGHEHHVLGEMASCLVMFPVGDLP